MPVGAVSRTTMSSGQSVCSKCCTVCLTVLMTCDLPTPAPPVKTDAEEPDVHSVISACSGCKSHRRTDADQHLVS